MRKTFLAVLCVSLMQGLLFDVDAMAAEQPSGRVGRIAEAFECNAVGGGSFRLYSALEEKRAVVMTFWGIRCGACIEEIPALNRIAAEYGKDGVQVVGVNVDGVDAVFLQDAMKNMGIAVGYTVVADPALSVMDKYSVQAAPTTMIIGKDRKIAYYHEGYRSGDEKELEKVLKGILGK